MKRKLVLMCGVPAVGKTTFINSLKSKNVEMNIISPDDIRVLLHGYTKSYDVETDTHYISVPQYSNNGVFAIAEKMARRYFEEKPHIPVVIDATNNTIKNRQLWVSLAKEYDAEIYRVILTASPKTIKNRNDIRRKALKLSVPNRVIDRFYNKENFKDKNYDYEFVYDTEQKWDNRNLADLLKGNTDLSNSFVVGDTHGQYNAFIRLLEKAGFVINEKNELTHPNNTRLIVLGDFVDRGKDSVKMCQSLMKWSKKGSTIVLRGNHEEKIVKVLKHHYKPERVYNMTPNQHVFVRELFKLHSGYVKEILNWMDNLPIIVYNDDYIITHAGLTHDDYRLVNKHDALHGNTSKQSNVDTYYKGWRTHIHGHVSNKESNKDVINLDMSTYDKETDTFSMEIKGAYIDNDECVTDIYTINDGFDKTVDYDNATDYHKFKNYIKYNNAKETKSLISFGWSDDNRYCILKYSKKAFGRQLLTEVNKKTRGHVYDAWTGKFVANPFYKFENDTENKEDMLARKNMSYKIFEKYDGFLFNVSKTDIGELVYSCSGSVGDGAKYVKYAKDIIETMNYDFSKLEKGKTYIFEGIDPENDVHYIDYKHSELMLLNIRDLETGEYYLDDIEKVAKAIGCNSAREYSHKEFLNILYKDIRNYNLSEYDDIENFANMEGFVLYFEDGFMSKVKLLEYLIVKAKDRGHVDESLINDIADFREGFFNV